MIRTDFHYELENDFDYVVTIDGDGQHDPLQIPDLLSNVVNNGHDVSIGYHVGNDTEMLTWRRVGKRVLERQVWAPVGLSPIVNVGFAHLIKKRLKRLHQY